MMGGLQIEVIREKSLLLHCGKRGQKSTILFLFSSLSDVCREKWWEMFVSRFGTRENIQLPSFSSKDTKTFRLWKTHKKKGEKYRKTRFGIQFSHPSLDFLIKQTNSPNRNPKKREKKKKKKKRKKKKEEFTLTIADDSRLLGGGWSSGSVLSAWNQKKKNPTWETQIWTKNTYKICTLGGDKNYWSNEAPIASSVGAEIARTTGRQASTA